MNELIMAILMRGTAAYKARPLASFDQSRHARFALACGRALRVTDTFARPHAARMTAWTDQKVLEAAAAAKAGATYAAHRVVEGNFEDRLAHNRAAILESINLQAVRDEHPSVVAGALLNGALQALRPGYALTHWIVFRDAELELFVGNDVQATKFAPGTPLLVRKIHFRVEGAVTGDLLKQMADHARATVTARAAVAAPAEAAVPVELVEPADAVAPEEVVAPAEVPAPAKAPRRTKGRRRARAAASAAVQVLQD